MSRVFDDPSAWLELGSWVWFDAPGWHHRVRLYGEIVRTSSNPAYFHVEVDGTRYEVDLHRDHMSTSE